MAVALPVATCAQSAPAIHAQSAAPEAAVGLRAARRWSRHPIQGGGATIYASVEKLGLKLEQRKAKVEQVVVDSAEKTPTEN
jgi:uncharacterized protein (TIGR03435 family)